MAWILYGELIRPVEHVLSDAKHVFVVADGPLAALPLSVLVTDQPQGSDTDPQALRDTAWLIKRYALTTLPSVSSLAIVRGGPEADGPGKSKTFMGFGAPVLGGEKAPVAIASNDGQSFFRGALADVEAVRDLPPLPQTGPELRRLAAALGAGERRRLSRRPRHRDADQADGSLAHRHPGLCHAWAAVGRPAGSGRAGAGVHAAGRGDVGR